MYWTLAGKVSYVAESTVDVFIQDGQTSNHILLEISSNCGCKK